MSRYLSACASIMGGCEEIKYASTAKYLGVMLCSGKCFSVDVHYAKSNFYSKFNSVFHKGAKFHNELILLHIVAAYCKPYLFYCTEGLDLSVRQLRSLDHAWCCAISHIFHVTGADVNLISHYTATVPFDELLRNRRLNFINGLCSASNTVLWYIYNAKVNRFAVDNIAKL